MFRGYGIRIKIFLLLLAFGTLGQAVETIKVTNGRPCIPIDILKICPMIRHMIEGVDGYACIKEINSIQLPGVDAGTSYELLSILLGAKITLGVNDMSLVEYGILQPTIEQILKSRNSERLLDLMTMANFLDVKPIVLGSAKVWSQKYSAVKSNFKDLNVDLKKTIIKELCPSELMALVEANDNLDRLAKEEVFRMALEIHRNKESEMGESAQELYEELLSNRFVLIPGGEYEIGSSSTEANRCGNERLHAITLSPFEIMKAPVTQEQYAMKMGKNPSVFKEDKPGAASFKIIEVNGNRIPVWSDHPVENVTWFQAEEYAKALSKDDPKYNYHLPTEAQLEVAFRGGTKTTYVSGNDESRLGDYVWYQKNANGQTHPVKSKLANAYGIHRGSVYEWTADWYDQSYSGSVGLDPKGPISGSRRVVRGGGFCSIARNCRSAYRDDASSGCHDGILGFRLVRTKK